MGWEEIRGEKRKGLVELTRSHTAFLLFLALVILTALVYGLSEARTYIALDGEYYYSFLPEIFIQKQLGPFVKYPLGTALMILPFFLAAHGLAHILPGQVMDGYSPIYQYAVALAALVYCILGFILLYRILLLYFRKKTAALCCICIYFGTMLPAYAVRYASFSHVYAFALINYFFWLVLTGRDGSTWEKGSSPARSFLLGACAGLIFLIRNTDLTVLLLYLLYGFGMSGFSARLKRLFHPGRLALNAAGFLLPASLQLAYWKLQTGSFITNSYSGESFTFLTDPKILELLFSDVKGLFIFCPVLAFSIAGIFYVCRKEGGEERAAFPACLLILLANVYIYAAWWCWWLGAAYGIRSFCDILCIFAIFMAAFFEHFAEWAKGLVRLVLRLMLYILTAVFLLDSLAFQYAALEGRLNENLSGWFELNEALKNFYTAEYYREKHWWTIRDGENHFPVKNSYFLTRFPQKENSSFVSGGEGWLLFGPYKELPAGDYDVTFCFGPLKSGSDVEDRLPESERRKGTAAEALNNEAASADTLGWVGLNSSSGAFDPADYQAQIPEDEQMVKISGLHLEENCPGFELQVYAYREGLQIEEIIIEKH